MALTPNVITMVAYALASAKLIVKDKVENIIANFESVSLEYLHEATKIDIETLETFKNQTLPCLYNVSMEYKNNPNISDYDMMWVKCFYYVIPVPKPIIPCDEAGLSAFVNLTMFSFSVLMLLIMTFCVQRRQRACLKCCWGFPGPVVPLNMLDSYENRKGYMLCFGITISSIVAIFIGDNRSAIGGFAMAIETVSSSAPWIMIFVKIFLAMYVAVINYPFFIAQNIHNKLIGSLFGIAFCLAWIGLESFKIYVNAATCFKKYEQDNVKNLNVIVIFLDVPKYICLLLLMGKFVYVLVKTVKLRAEKKRKGLRVNWLHEDDTDWRNEFLYTHVKEVFKKHLNKEAKMGRIEDLSLKNKIITIVKSKLYEAKPGFQYSTRIIIATFASSLVVYLLSIFVIMFGYIAFDAIWDLIFNSSLIKAISDFTGISLQTVEDYLNCVQVSYWLGLVFSLIFYCLVTMNQLTWYRRHIMRLRKGDRSFLPNSIKNNEMGAGPLMVASFKFAGFQVAYAGYGFIISSVIFLLASYVISTQLFLPMHRGQLSILLTLVLNLWPNILIAVAMIVAQILIAKCCFLHDSDTLAVDNRRGYHILSYFLFYFNILLGLVSCLLRILFGMILGVIFLQRLAKSTLPRSYERRDPGYLAYVGFLLIEHQHSNPVLQCFVRLLLETQGMELKDEFFSNPQGDGSSIGHLIKISVSDKDRNKARMEKFRQSKIRNRWHLFTIMSLNPSIIKYRIRDFQAEPEKRKTSFFKSRFAFGFKNDCFEEQFVIREEPLKEDGNDTTVQHYLPLDEKLPLKELLDKEEEEETQQINHNDNLTRHSWYNETKRESQQQLFGDRRGNSVSPVDGDNNEEKDNNNTTGGNTHFNVDFDTINDSIINVDSDNTISRNNFNSSDTGDIEDDISVDFKDNIPNVVDTDESTPIITRKAPSSPKHIVTKC